LRGECGGVIFGLRGGTRGFAAALLVTRDQPLANEEQFSLQVAIEMRSKAMGFFRSVAKALLAMLLLLDTGLIWHFWKYGRPVTYIVKDVSPDVVGFRVERMPITIWDWVDLSILVAIHAILISFLLMRGRRKRLPKAEASA